MLNPDARPNLNTPQTNNISEDLLRSALKDWDSLSALGSHPLAKLGIVENCRQEAKYTPTATGRGLALRKVIQSAIDAMKPEGEAPEPDEKSWRRFMILQEQYVHGRSPEWVAQQLHVSKGTYYGEQKKALEMLADLLRKWDEEQQHPAVDEPALFESSPAFANLPFMAPVPPPQPFVGRNELLDELACRLKGSASKGLVVLVGLPGVGKTTLAIELAHRPEILEHFRDGVLWASLGREPDIAGLLARWAVAVGAQPDIGSDRIIYGVSAHSDVAADRALYGVSSHSKPSSRLIYGVDAQSDILVTHNLYGVGAYTDVIAERAAAIHTAIGMRRMLLIIDDAWQIDAALAFKVGGPNCAYLLTTRLANIALDFAGDQVITVHELNADDGLKLLTQMAALAVEADPDAARSLVQLVGGLPLALSLVGQYLQKQSYHAQPRRMREALAELQIARTRLELEQPQSPLESRPDLPPNTPLTLQTSIGLSRAVLESSAHRALVELALFAPKPNTFSEEAALAVTQASTKILDTLVDCGLLESVAPDRYTLHQTIADYASLEGTELAALMRLVNYFVGYAEKHVLDARALDLELENLLTTANFAENFNLCDVSIRLANALYALLVQHGRYQIAERLLFQAEIAALDLGDFQSQATMFSRLSEIEVKRGESDQARIYLEQALATARQAQLSSLENEILQQLQKLGELSK